MPVATGRNGPCALLPTGIQAAGAGRGSQRAEHDGQPAAALPAGTALGNWHGPGPAGAVAYTPLFFLAGGCQCVLGGAGVSGSGSESCGHGPWVRLPELGERPAAPGHRPPATGQWHWQARGNSAPASAAA